MPNSSKTDGMRAGKFSHAVEHACTNCHLGCLRTDLTHPQRMPREMFPKSIAEAMAEKQIMQILIFSLFFGVAPGKVPGLPGQYLKRSIDGLMEVMLLATNAVMALAPFGIVAAIASVVTVQGLGVIVTYGRLIGWFDVALFALWTVLYFSGRVVVGRRMPELLRAAREPMMIAFSTASSETAYPKLTEVLQRFGIRKRLVGFVLPL